MKKTKNIVKYFQINEIFIPGVSAEMNYYYYVRCDLLVGRGSQRGKGGGTYSFRIGAKIHEYKFFLVDPPDHGSLL